MAEDGMDALKNRMERRQRTVVPPARPKVVLPETPPAPAEVKEPASQAPKPKPTAAKAKPPKPKVQLKPEIAGGYVMAVEPKSNMSLQVRRRFDQRVDRLVYELKEKRGIRASKVEVAEVAFSDLPEHLTDEFEAKLQALRESGSR